MPSVLTDGLDAFRGISDTIDELIDKLLNLEVSLHREHQLAVSDSEHGAPVVHYYRTFLEYRRTLIEELQLKSIDIPWQLMLRIKELDLAVA